MVTSHQRSIIDIHPKKKKELNPTLKLLIKSEENRTKEKGTKDPQKQIQNN